MIRFFEKNDEKTVVSLWIDTFGDKKEFVCDFLSRFGRYMLVLEYEEKVVSMLTLFPVKIGNENGRYVYAVATDKYFRSRGFAGKLIEYAKKLVADNNEKFLVILPQNSSLFDFYKKFGFSELNCVKYISKQISKSKENLLNVETVNENEYFDLRKQYFKNGRFVEWDIDMLSFFKNIYSGTFLKLSENGKETGLAFCFKNDDVLYVSELLVSKNEDKTLCSLGYFFNKNSVIAIRESKNGEKFAMIYPKEFTDCYFGLGMS